MTAYFYRTQERLLWPKYEIEYPWGVPVLKIALPVRYSPRRLGKLTRRLYKRGLRRFLSGEERPELHPLVPLSPLPLCRAKGAELALALLPGLAARERRIALRGEAAGAQAWMLAERLCPQVGALLLDFERGEETLACRLRERYGAAPLHLGQGPVPQVAVELDPRPRQGLRTLSLWGEPELQGLALTAEEALPSNFPQLPFLELLWETGRIDLDRVRVVRAEE